VLKLISARLPITPHLPEHGDGLQNVLNTKLRIADRGWSPSILKNITKKWVSGKEGGKV